MGFADETNARRGPGYSSLDLMHAMEGNLLGLKLGGFFQIKNVGAQPND